MTSNDNLIRPHAALGVHPCTQMKPHQCMPMVPVWHGQGAWLYDIEGRPLPGRDQLLVGEPTRSKTPIRPTKSCMLAIRGARCRYRGRGH
jgi:hypothetical protein